MANCSTGSNRGYDELVPHHIDVVHETRLYPKWGYQQHQTNEKTAMISTKKSLNNLHVYLAQQGFTQLLVDQLSTSVLLLTRYNPLNHQSILLIAHTSFVQCGDKWDRISPLSIQGVIDKIIIESSLNQPIDKEPIKTFQRSKEYINGLEQTKVYLNENILIEESKLMKLTSSNSIDYNGFRTIEFTDDFRPGSIVVLQISVNKNRLESIHQLDETIKQFSNPESEFNLIVKELTLIDIERVLYRTSVEEQSDGKGFDVYEIPDYGKLVYAGLQGQISVLEEIHSSNEIKHPLIINLKHGDWLMNYISNRLKIYPNTKQLGDWFEKTFSFTQNLSRLMIPSYFDLILKDSFRLIKEQSLSLMTPFIRSSSQFVQDLSQSSVQLVSVVRDARLPMLSPNLREPKPIEQIDEQTRERIQLSPSLAAGFPHFGAGIWRNWGRDTFISLRGLLLLTGRFEEARYLILSYGGCLRHGLIPNLLGDGKIARYNARDAVWWWCYSISCYTRFVPDGHEILSDKVSRLYPTHDSPLQAPGLHDQSLFDVIQEVFLRHIQSLTFRERGAGHSLDSDMNDEGFNNHIGVDNKTGFVLGGNKWNCGTWMDKMGSSERAKNKGYPATPRDGSAVELVGLSRATISWIIDMNKEGHYPYDSIETSIGKTFIYLFIFILFLFEKDLEEK
jgi:glycogen debranching enzyme